MPKWERQLEVYYSLIDELVEKRKKGKGKLRFGRLSIIASDIAEQYFCEKKVTWKAEYVAIYHPSSFYL